MSLQNGLVICGLALISVSVVLMFRKARIVEIAISACMGLCLIVLGLPLGRSLQKLEMGKEGLTLEFSSIPVSESPVVRAIDETASSQPPSRTKPQGPPHGRREDLVHEFSLSSTLGKIGFQALAIPSVRIGPGTILAESGQRITVAGDAADAFDKLPIQTATTAIDALPKKVRIFDWRLDCSAPLVRSSTLSDIQEHARKDRFEELRSRARENGYSFSVVVEALSCQQSGAAVNSGAGLKNGEPITIGVRKAAFNFQK
jgi:hypothetical protein